MAQIIIDRNSEDVDKLYADLADEFGLTKAEVKQMVQYQFKFVGRKMTSLDTRPTRLMYLGVFKMKTRIYNELKLHIG